MSDQETKSGLGRFIGEIDQLLRGAYTSREHLRDGKINVPVGTLVFASLLMGAVYGACMGLFSAITRTDGEGWNQLLSTSLKVPLLFLLTLVVTFPSLYVFSALSRSRLGLADTLRLLLAAVGVNLALLASFGPVTAFFTFCTDSYPFMVVLNVSFFAIAGLIGLGFLRKALTAALGEEGVPPASTEGESARPVVMKQLSGTVFRVWLVIYGVVGAQMGWILRPFVGSPDLPFEWFRTRAGNFFAAFLDNLEHLFR